MRNLTKTLAVVSILAPAGAYPLGIGDIKLHSALNQNLNAEIALVLSGEKPDDIQVQLAPPDKFNEAGVPWSYFLSKIKFETVTRPNGSVVIKLTSNEALKEPFLDLLLEVSWPKGNLYREFTVLVDPPAVYKQSTIPVISSPQRYQADAYTLPQRRSTPRRAQTHFAARGEYGPTKRNDTLWKVAEKVKPDADVSVEQMMIALYEQNPRAFYQDNVNALSAGKTLKVPGKETALKLSRKQALAEFNRQTKAWRNQLAPAAESLLAEKEGADKQLTLDAPTEAEVTENAALTPGNEKTASPAPAAPGKSEANDALQSKIAALEKQLATMQQIIALKDQQLAALQNKGQVSIPTPTEPAVQPVEPEPTVQEPPAKVEPPAPAVQAQPEAPAPEPAKPVIQTKPATPPPAQPASPPVAEESSPDLYYPIVGAVGTAMLSILGWLWWRKRKIEEETNTESMFASSPASRSFSSEAPVTDSMINQVNSAPESSFLSEFTATDFDSFDIDQSEIDPIAEADVYLAYGRYHQAEELIKQAVNELPARDDCKLKLLEIYQATDNKKAFETYVHELVKTGKKDDLPFWAKVAEMGRELCPDSSLFASETAHFATVEDDLDSEEQLTGGKVLSLSKTDTEEEPDYVPSALDTNSSAADVDQESAEDNDNVLNFDLTSFAAKEDTAADKNNNGLDYDFIATEADVTTTGVSDAGVSLDKDRVLDFDFNALTDTNGFLVDDQQFNENLATHNLPKAEEKLSGLDLDSDDDLQNLDFAYDASNLDESGDDSCQEEDFQFDFEMPDDEDTDDIPQNGYGVSDLTDMDEFETKLDLARAYIDMGDPDSAKDIVKEVLERGSAEQQKIAQELLVDL